MVAVLVFIMYAYCGHRCHEGEGGGSGTRHYAYSG